MKIGDIILIPFPYAELTKTKVRPAVVIAETVDKFKDLVVSSISSVVPCEISTREILLKPNGINNLRANSIIKVDRIVTLKRTDVIADLGKLSGKELTEFKSVLSSLIK